MKIKGSDPKALKEYTENIITGEISQEDRFNIRTDKEKYQDNMKIERV